jgi:hypothetical protein
MRALTWATIVAIAAMAAAPAVAAQEADTSTAAPDHGKRPQLGGHRFIPNPMIRDPFPRTLTRMSVGFGHVEDLPISAGFPLGPGDTLDPVTATLEFTLLDFEYQQRIKSWMAFWVKVDAKTRVGGDTGALLAEGVTVSRALEIGWMFRLLETDRVALSATAQVLNKHVTAVQLFEYIKGVIDSVEVPLVVEVPLTRVGGSLRFAWAANAWLGFNATGGVEYGESTDRTEENSTSGVAGLSADIDFAPLINAPVGLVLAGQAVFAPDRTIRNLEDAKLMFIRVAYTGREDYLVAFDVVVAKTPLGTVTATTVTTKIGMRYYF